MYQPNQYDGSNLWQLSYDARAARNWGDMYPGYPSCPIYGRNRSTPKHSRWQEHRNNRRQDSRPYDRAERRSYEAQQPSNQGYPAWQIKAANEALEYRVFEPKFSQFRRQTGIYVRGEICSMSLQPNPKWHGTCEDYENAFLPYGGPVDVQDEEAEVDQQTGASNENENHSAEAVQSTDNSARASPKTAKPVGVVSQEQDQCSPDGADASSLSSSSSSQNMAPTTDKSVADACEVVIKPQPTMKINKCDYCDYTGKNVDIPKHLEEEKHSSASRYEALQEGQKESLCFVDTALKWTNDSARYQKVAALCHLCPHEVFEDIFQCAAHCDVMHSQPNVYALSEVVWKGTCTINRSFKCSKCHQGFNRLQKLNTHWRQNVDHFPSNIGKYMNGDYVVYFYCSYCQTRHWDFFAMANHIINGHVKKPAEVIVLVMSNKKRECTLPPLKHPKGDTHMFVQLSKLLTHTKHTHGAKSQAAKKVKQRIAYHEQLTKKS